MMNSNELTGTGGLHSSTSGDNNNSEGQHTLSQKNSKGSKKSRSKNDLTKSTQKKDSLTAPKSGKQRVPSNSKN
jgi:hypothetical protein